MCDEEDEEVEQAVSTIVPTSNTNICAVIDDTKLIKTDDTHQQSVSRTSAPPWLAIRSVSSDPLNGLGYLGALDQANQRQQQTKDGSSSPAEKYSWQCPRRHRNLWHSPYRKRTSMTSGWYTIVQDHRHRSSYLHTRQHFSCRDIHHRLCHRARPQSVNLWTSDIPS